MYLKDIDHTQYIINMVSLNSFGVAVTGTIGCRPGIQFPLKFNVIFYQNKKQTKKTTQIFTTKF